MYFLENGKIATGIGAALSNTREWREVYLHLAFDGEPAEAQGWLVPIPGGRPTFHFNADGAFLEPGAVEAAEGLFEISGFGLSIGEKLLLTAPSDTAREIDLVEAWQLVAEIANTHGYLRVGKVLSAFDRASIHRSALGLLVLSGHLLAEAAEPFSEDSNLYRAERQGDLAQP